jgi:hypothetical protein
MELLPDHSIPVCGNHIPLPAAYLSSDFLQNAETVCHKTLNWDSLLIFQLTGVEM